MIMPENILVNRPLLERIAQYLATKPYAEVAGMMHELMSLKPDDRPAEGFEKEVTNG